MSSAYYGETVKLPGIPAGIPVAALIGDSHAVLVRSRRLPARRHQSHLWHRIFTDDAHRHPDLLDQGLSSSIAWGYREARHALEGNIYVTRAAVQWLAEFLGLGDAGQVEALAARAGDNGDVYFVPALTGLGAPYWSDAARGLITGLTRGQHCCGGCACHAGSNCLSGSRCVRDDAGRVRRTAAGAPSRWRRGPGNGALMQFQADILGTPVLCSLVSDVSALGAAYLAGLTAGLWSSESEICPLARPHVRYRPAMADSQRARLYVVWKRRRQSGIGEPPRQMSPAAPSAHPRARLCRTVSWISGRSSG